MRSERLTLLVSKKGIAARCVMIGTLTARPLVLFDILLQATGATKFHFHDPAEEH